MKIFVDEPVPPYKSSSDRRKSVFVEPYNPEDDDGDDTKVIIFPDSNIERFLLQVTLACVFCTICFISLQ